MGIFLSLDLICFFVFWEAMLVPMYFLIAGWGSKRRVYAAMKFFIYTVSGSAFLLASILVLGFLHQNATGHLTFDYRVLARLERAGVEHREAAVPRLHDRVRDQGAAVPVPHLAARRAHRGTDRGLGRAGRRHPEDGRLRVPALLVRAVPEGLGVLRAVDHDPGGDRHHLRVDRRGDADRHETRASRSRRSRTWASSSSASSR